MVSVCGWFLFLIKKIDTTIILSYVRSYFRIIKKRNYIPEYVLITKGSIEAILLQLQFVFSYNLHAIRHLQNAM